MILRLIEKRRRRRYLHWQARLFIMAQDREWWSRQLHISRDGSFRLSNKSTQALSSQMTRRRSRELTFEKFNHWVTAGEMKSSWISNPIVNHFKSMKLSSFEIETVNIKIAWIGLALKFILYYTEIKIIGLGLDLGLKIQTI